MPEGVRVLEAAASRFGIGLEFDHFDFACWPYFERHGSMMPDDWQERIGGHDAILFGAVGWPEKIPDHVSLWGSLLKFRRDFDLYANLRPARLMPGVRSPLAGLAPGDIDMMIVRENTEGEYSTIGGRMYPGHRARGRGAGDRDVAGRRRPRPEVRLRAGAVAAEEAPHLGDQVERHRDHDAVLGRARRGDGRAAIPDVRVDRYHIDILTAHFVQRPQIFDTVVASNLFGDILSDLGPACTGTIGIAPVGQHQSDARASVAVRAGARLGARHRRARGIANPIGQIWSAALMLDFLGHRDAHDAIIAAIEIVLEPSNGGPRTRDLGGSASTSDVGRAIADALSSARTASR